MHYIASSLFILIFYHIILFWRYKKHPLNTSHGRYKQIRAKWVKSVTGKDSILAVQSLRNWTMSSTFMASTALIISMGSLKIAFSSQTASWSLLSKGASLITIDVRMLIMAIFYYAAFFNFSLALRSFNHVVFMSEFKEKDMVKVLEQRNVILNTLNRGAKHHMLGMRAYYLSIPLAAWLMGDLWFFVGSLATLPILHYVDA